MHRRGAFARRIIGFVFRTRGLVLFAMAKTIANAADAPSSRMLDDFRDASRWSAVASDQITASLRRDGDALCLDYDFNGVSGYAGMRRSLPIDYPDNYEFRFRVRGNAPDNALQFKLADAKGENVWWVNRPDFRVPHEWQEIRYPKRKIDFAWGPAKDKTLRSSASIEFTVYAGKGGRGEICFDDLRLRTLPPPPAVMPKPIASATSSRDGSPAANAIDGNDSTAWRSDPSQGAEQALTLDLGIEREFGGLVLHWIGDRFARRYDIEVSDDAHDWRTIRRVVAGNGGVDPLFLPDASARYLRIAMHGTSGSYALGGIDIKDLAFGASANAFFAELAKDSPRGWYPRGFYGEQTYWTVVGISGGHESGLISEDGAIEVARGGFSIAPFLIDAHGALTSWADAKIAHSLQDGYLPIPSVTWSRNGIELSTTAFADGAPGGSRLVASYTLTNDGNEARETTLALVAQPFQVNPAVQFLNTPGGISPIHNLAFDANTLSVDSKPRAFALAAPDAAMGSTFDGGLAVEHLGGASRLIGTTKEPIRDFAVHDATGLASGALLYRVRIPAHASRTIGLVIPLDGDTHRPELAAGETASQWIDARRNPVAAEWRERLGHVSIHVPASAQPLVDTLRTALADILISRDGAALRPGTRSYARSWIRDGAMMSEALLRLGHADAARDYLEWFAPYQFRNGKVPCCVDARGSDPVPENDSHGELIHLAAEVYRYTGDRALLENIWPHVDAAVRYMDELRLSERTPAIRNEHPSFYGLMPASISHEGYSAKPMHSYWDDFWALTGYDDAVTIAEALGRQDARKRIAHSRDEFRGDLHASIRAAVAAHGIDYLPGCAELGDFDATSTTIALSPAGQQSSLPQNLLLGTFERYWTQFDERRRGAIAWKDYTPYEWRTVASFVRLGWRDRAQQAIDFFMHDRRPPEWNQWAEVVGRDPRESRFVGDMPHGWVASDFIRSALDLFAYERYRDRAMVLAAGVAPSWLDGDGIAIRHLRTPYGPLGYSLRRDGRVLHLEIDAETRVPPGGLVLAWPHITDAHMNGRNVPLRNGELRVERAPADVVIETASP